MVVRNFSTPARAVFYLRRSDPKQEESIPAQRAALQAYLEAHGYILVREYVDDGISGDDTEYRLAFRRMVWDAAELKDFDLILCWDQDRFGRFDPLEAGYWIKPLRDEGVRLETVTGGPVGWDDFAGRIVYAVKQEGKHAYLIDLSGNVARGVVTCVKDNGGWPGGNPPYGYRLATVTRNGKEVTGLEPDPAEAPVLKELFARYARGDVSLKQLANDLNGRGVPTRGGGPWAANVVKQILVNPCYLGKVVANKRHEGKYHRIAKGAPLRADRKRTGKKGQPIKRHISANDPSEWVVAGGEDTHEALVTRELFDRVKAVLVERRKDKGLRTPHVGGGDFLLSGLVTCANCGHRMAGRHSHATAGGDVVVYVCTGGGNYGKHVCRYRRVHERALVEFVANEVWHMLTIPRHRQEWERRIREDFHTRQAPVNLDSVRREVADLARQIAEDTRRYLRAPEHMLADLAAEVEKQKAQKAALEAVLAEAERVAHLKETLEARIEAAVRKVCAMHVPCPDDEQRGFNRQAVREFVDRVECDFVDVDRGEGRTGKRIVRSTLTRARVYLKGDRFFPREFLPELYSPGGRLSQLCQDALCLTYIPAAA